MAGREKKSEAHTRMKTFHVYRFHRLQRWQAWLAAILGGAVLLAILVFVSAVALAGFGLALLLTGCGLAVSALRRLIGREAAPAAFPQGRYAVIPTREIRRVEVEVLDGCGPRRW